MSILFRYTVREVLAHLAGVMAVVLGVFLIRRFGALLDAAADGSLPTAVILHLLGLRTIVALPSLVPVVVYLGVLLALGRLYRDEEMTALAACGVGPGRVRTAMLGLAVVAALVVGGLSFSARPWAAAEFSQVRARALVALDVGSMTPGRFYEIEGEGEQVIFAEGRSATDPRFLEHVFVQQRQGERLTVLVSERAVEYRDAAGMYRFLRLLNGYRYDLDADRGDYEITRYGEFVVRGPLGGVLEDQQTEKGQPNADLLRSNDPGDIAELQWRLAMPVSTILLVALAIPLSRVRPRQGKYGRLFIGILIYVVYRHLLSAAKSWVADGTLAPFPGFWVIHALCLATAMALFFRDSVRGRELLARIQDRRARMKAGSVG